MFNLGNLLGTIAISMGAANVAPIYDGIQTKQAENVVNNYTIELTETRVNTLTNNNELVNNYNNASALYDYNYGTIGDAKFNVTGTSPYLNILANKYTTNVYASNNDDGTFYYNRYLEEVNDLNHDIFASNQILYVMKITPYNFNVNTEITFQLVSQVSGFELVQWNEIEILSVNRYRKVYTTTQENWDSYIDKQLVKNTTKAIINDIEDINNGFYYDATEDITEFSWNANANRYEMTDTFNISIVPNVDNYIIIQLACLVDAYERHGGAYDIEWDASNVMTKGTMSSYPPTITGTNIIADTSNYEVIDLPGLMFQILAMPFAFVSQAFNLTLFPGTPYQVNISNLFLSIIAIFVFIWIISLFLKMKG